MREESSTVAEIFREDELTEKAIFWKIISIILLGILLLMASLTAIALFNERSILREKLGSEEVAIRLHPECMKIRLEVITGSRLETGWEQAERCIAQHAAHAGMEE